MEYKIDNWAIITDSSCDLIRIPGGEGIAYYQAPFMIRIGDRDYIDDDSLDVDGMVDNMEAEPSASRTACPSPAAWMDHFGEADNIIIITITANMSGSYNSAMTALKMAKEEYPDKRIYAVNSKTTGPGVALCVEKAADLIRQGLPFDEITAQLEEFVDRLRTIFALCSFDNLIKNGRMHKIAGFVAGKLGLWGIGIGDPEGRIKMKGLARGALHTLSTIVADMKENLYNGGKVVISHCQNLEMAEKLRNMIKESWDTAEVDILTTRGLDSFYAERHGLIVCY
ncbi:MAG: DegV family EDD domain-containing protein [Eubacteriaceae bacterium]|nr:DegV family EDD domain-containing protein [Eubacteriaceae bacterium]